MTGNAVIITADGTPIPSSMSCTININHEAVEYTPLPGSVTAEEEGWKHYRRGNYSWSLQNDSFLTDLNVGVAELSGTKPQVGINIGEKITLAGTGVIKSVKMSGNVNGLAKLNISLEGDNLPEIEVES